jgi:DNA-binding transcriptional LysR family regulator
LILIEKNASSRRHLEALFKEKKLTLKPQIELAVHDLLIRFASIHLGVSCVVREFSKESLSNGTIKELKLDPPLPARNIGYAYRKNTPLSVAAKTFLDLLEQPIS